MPDKENYVVARSNKGGFMLTTHEEWLSFKYCGKQDVLEHWEQIDLSPDQLMAVISLHKILSEKLNKEFQ